MSKGLDWASWDRGLRDYRIGLVERPAVRRGIPIVEACIGLLLALSVSVASAIAMLLFVAFAGVLTVAVRRGATGECSCFGALARTRIGPTAIARAVGLALACFIVLLIDPPLLLLQPTAALAGTVAMIVYGELQRLRRGVPRRPLRGP